MDANAVVLGFLLERLSGGPGEIKLQKSKWDVLAGCYSHIVRNL